jgi:hypothetical protein
MNRIVLALLVLVLSPAFADAEETHVTIVLRSGEEVRGELLDIGTVRFRVRVAGEVREIPGEQVARVKFDPDGAAPPTKLTPVGEILAKARETGAIERVLRDAFLAGDSRDGEDIERTLVQRRCVLAGERLRLTFTIVEGEAKKGSARFIRKKDTLIEYVISPAGVMESLRIDETSYGTYGRSKRLEGVVRNGLLRLSSDGQPGSKDVIQPWEPDRLPPFLAEFVLALLYDQGLPEELSYTGVKGDQRTLRVGHPATTGKIRALLTIVGGDDSVEVAVLPGGIGSVKSRKQGTWTGCNAEHWNLLLASLRPVLDVHPVEDLAVIRERIGQRVILASRSETLRVSRQYSVVMENPDEEPMIGGVLELKGTVSNGSQGGTTWSAELLEGKALDKWLVPNSRVRLVLVEKGKKAVAKGSDGRVRSLRINVLVEEDLPLGDVVAAISSQVGRKIDVAHSAAARIPVKVRYQDVHWRDAVARLSREHGCLIRENSDESMTLRLPRMRGTRLTASQIEECSPLHEGTLQLATGELDRFEGELRIEDEKGVPRLSVRNDGSLLRKELKTSAALAALEQAPATVEWKYRLDLPPPRRGLAFLIRAETEVVWKVRIAEISTGLTKRDGTKGGWSLTLEYAPLVD